MPTPTLPDQDGALMDDEEPRGINVDDPMDTDEPNEMWVTPETAKYSYEKVSS